MLRTTPGESTNCINLNLLLSRILWIALYRPFEPKSKTNTSHVLLQMLYQKETMNVFTRRTPWKPLTKLRNSLNENLERRRGHRHTEGRANRRGGHHGTVAISRTSSNTGAGISRRSGDNCADCVSLLRQVMLEFILKQSHVNLTYLDTFLRREHELSRITGSGQSEERDDGRVFHFRDVLLFEACECGLFWIVLEYLEVLFCPVYIP